MTEIKDRIISLRNEKNMTQAQLAKELNISPSAIGMYEQGRRKPSYELLEEICDYFNVDMDYLMGRSDIKNKYQSGLKYDWEEKTDKTINEFFNTEMINSPELIEEISQLPFLDLWNKESPVLSSEVKNSLENDLNNLENSKDLKNFLQSLKIAKDSYLKYLKKLEEHMAPIKYKIGVGDSLEELKEIKNRYVDSVFVPKNAYFIVYSKNEKISYFLINPNKTSVKQLEKYVIEYKEKKYLKFLTKFQNEYIMMDINKNNKAESITKKDFKVLGTVIFEDSKE